MRLIDADHLMEQLNKYIEDSRRDRCSMYTLGLITAKIAVIDAPTVKPDHAENP